MTIQWNDIHEVVRYRDRIVIIYYIVTSIDGAPKEGFMAVTQQEDEFLRALESHNVPLRHRHFSQPDSELETPL